MVDREKIPPRATSDESRQISNGERYVVV